MDRLLNKLIQESGNWRRCLQIAHKNPDRENIHQFRLALKQLNAFVTVIGFPKRKNAHTETFQFLQKCFKAAGEIRKAELQSEKLASIQGEWVTKLQKKNKNKVDKSTIKWIQLLQHVNSADLLKFQAAFTFELEKLGSRQLVLLLNKTILKQFKELRKLSSKANYKKDMHNMRILIRRLMELLNVIESVENDDSFQPLSDLLKDLNKKMGHWHDASDFKNYIQSFTKQLELAPEELNVLLDQLQAEMFSLEEDIKELFLNGIKTS